MLGALAASGCASLPRQAPPEVAAAARDARSYSAELAVALRGPELRGRVRALVAFARPDRLRIEIPGPGGVRLVAVAREGRLVAVFPAERAFYEAAADASELELLLGIALAPAEVMDLLTGRAPERVRSYDVRWGPQAPARIVAGLPDGARLRVGVRDPQLGGELPAGAFEPPSHAGYRALDREEARSLWSGR
jgi:hypothetical protein